MPQAAAYDFDDGTSRWVSCTDELAWRTVRAVTGDAVYIESFTPVRSTVDGAVIWATQYPWEGAPTGSVRMSGVGIDDEHVFVAFATAASGGELIIGPAPGHDQSSTVGGDLHGCVEPSALPL